MATTQQAPSRQTRKQDLYQHITDRIIEQLEQGTRPWHKPWNAEHAAGRICRPLRQCGEPYHGINILMLWDSAEEQGFACPIWLTFKQAQSLGGHVKKGEKGTRIVYASQFSKTDTNASGEEETKEIPFLKQYTGFNAEQCGGLPDEYYALKQPPNSDIEPIESAQQLVKASGAIVQEGGLDACYVSSKDLIRMPKLETFVDAESHAATLIHELIHWTKHPSRLDRNLGRKKWGDEGYAMEELVAEMGAAFLCADLNITPEVRPDHADYIASWLKVLKQDKRAIVTAASMASKAADHLHGLQTERENNATTN